LFSFSQGAQGNLDGASNATLDNEFGTHNEEEVIKTIIEKGTIVQGGVRISANELDFVTNFDRALRDKVSRMRAWALEVVTRQSTSTI
jgi:hypothetical protein